MYKYLLAAFIVVLLWLPAVSAPAAAGEEAFPVIEEEVITASVTGQGRDPVSALDDAFKNAVAEAVASLIDEQTRIEQAPVIESQILVRSKSFVEKHEPVGKPEVRGGRTVVQADVVVKKEELWQALQNAGIINVTL